MSNYNTTTRKGYTLVEIMVSVTLMLLIMLGVSQLFSSVGTSMNNTQATLGMVANLRGAKMRLEKDLSMLTVDLSRTPPTASGTNSGYFCIMEGMGAHHGNGFLRTQDQKSPSKAIRTSDIAKNPDAEDAKQIKDKDGNFVYAYEYDTTVGDMDDVLMFTARAPEGEAFRGLINGRVEESNTAEVVWFCRGNTLYRRVLLIIPKEELNTQAFSTSAASKGEKFYQNYDVSVHFELNNGVPYAVANSLEDLQRREYRFAHICGFDNSTDSFQARFPFNIHSNAACYYLRMPTLTEMSHEKWNASKSFAWNLSNANRTNYDTAVVSNNISPDLEYDKTQQSAGDAPLNENTPMASRLPEGANMPFIDYWKAPFPWEQLRDPSNTVASGVVSKIDQQRGIIKELEGTRIAEDVMLTNVISFDVQVWDEEANSFINLGGGEYEETKSEPSWKANRGIAGWEAETSVLGTQGLYPLLKVNNNEHRQEFARKESATGAAASMTPLPCVYDTWSDQYETPGYSWRDQHGILADTCGRDQVDGNILDLGDTSIQNGVIDDPSEWTTPAPYPCPLRGIKITIRTFDRNSRSVREMTIVRDFSTGRN